MQGGQEGVKTAVIAVTESAEPTAKEIAEALPGCSLVYEREKGWLRENTERLFREYEGLIFIMASGIVVRMIAPFVDSKYSDPAVVVVDDARRYAISLLSGHEGGANALAARVATILRAEPVITTASDTNRRIIIGVGCRRGTPAAEITNAAGAALESAGLEWTNVRAAATIDIKHDEPGITECFGSRGIPVVYFSKEQINRFDGPYSVSETALRNIGVRAVAEPCALLAGRKTALILPKQKTGKITIALAQEDAEDENK